MPVPSKTKTKTKSKSKSKSTTSESPRVRLTLVEKARKALSEIKNEGMSVNGASREFKISAGILRGQLRGRRFMKDTGAIRSKLNPAQEQALIAYIRNQCPDPSEIRHKANVLLNMHSSSDDEPQEVGKNWVLRFRKRHNC